MEKELDNQHIKIAKISNLRVKRFIDLAVTEFAGLVTCCEDAAFYPTTCTFKSELSKLGNRLAVSQEIIKPIVKHQGTIKQNLQQIKHYLEELRRRLPTLLKYSETYFNLIPVIIQGFQENNSFLEIQKILEKSLEAEIIEGVTKSLAAIEAIILIADPTKLSVAMTVVFSVVGLVMNIVSQKKENARLGKQLSNVEDKWEKMEEILRIVSTNSKDLEKNWKTLEQTATVYGRKLNQAYIHLQKLLPHTFTRQLPGTNRNWTPLHSVVNIRNWDERYKISKDIHPVQIIKKVFQLEVDTNLAIQIMQEVEEFLVFLEEDFDKIFAQYLSGVNNHNNFSTNEKLVLLNNIAPAISEKLSINELIKRSKNEGLNINRTSLFKILSNIMDNKQCYGIYPLDYIRSGNNHFILNVDVSPPIIEYIKRKTQDQDYSVDTLVRKLKKRSGSNASQWNRQVVLYMIAAIYPSATSYMGEKLDSLRICTLTTERSNSTTSVQTADYDYGYDYLSTYNDYDYLNKYKDNYLLDYDYPSSGPGRSRRRVLNLTLRKYQEVYDEDYQGCKWRIETGSSTTSLNNDKGVSGQRQNAWAKVGHDRLNVHGDVETGHRHTHRSDTDWAKARGGYTVGELNHDGKVGARAHIADNGIHMEANAGTNLNVAGDLLQIGVDSKAETKSFVDVGQGIDVKTGVGIKTNAQIFGDAGPKVGFGIGSGLGVKGGLNPRDNNVGGSVLTPVGSFGVHAGCKNEVCFFGCVTIVIC